MAENKEPQQQGYNPTLSWSPFPNSLGRAQVPGTVKGVSKVRDLTLLGIMADRIQAQLALATQAAQNAMGIPASWRPGYSEQYIPETRSPIPAGLTKGTQKRLQQVFPAGEIVSPGHTPVTQVIGTNG